MARLSHIILLQAAGIDRLMFDPARSSLLKANHRLPTKAVFPLLKLLYKGGLSDEEKGLETYFFPEKYSWVIFEMENKKKFFQIAFCRQERLGAYFINGTFEEEVFMQEGQLSEPSQVMALVKKHKWHHSPFVDSQAEYRSIIWQNYSGDDAKKLQRFSLKSVDQHSHIYNLLDQIEKGSNVDRSLLKEILLTYIPQAKDAINLKSIREQLAGFKAVQQDIRAFENQKTLADSFQASYTNLIKLENTKERLLHDIVRQAIFLKQSQQGLLQEQKSHKEVLNKLQDDLSKADVLFQEKRRQKIAELGYLEGQLKEAQEKKDAYPEELTHEEAIQRSQEETNNRNTLLRREKWLQQEQRLVYKTYLDQHQALLDELTSKQQNLYTEQHLSSQKLSEVNQKIIELQLQPDEEGAANMSKQVTARIESDTEDRLNKSYLQETIQLVSQQREAELALLDAAKEQEEQQIQLSLAPLFTRKSQLDKWLEQKSGSFYSWLDERYPGWQKTIGKIVKEDVLFHTGLYPNVVRLNDLLYGIQLNATEIDQPAPSLDELRLERDSLEENIQNKQDELKAFVEENLRLKQNVDKKYRSKLKQLRNKLQEIDIRTEQAELKKKKLEAEGKISLKLAHQEIQGKIIRLQYEASELENRLLELGHLFDKLQQHTQNSIAAARFSMNRQLDQLQKKLDEEIPLGKSDNESSIDWDQFWLDQILFIGRIPWLEEQIAIKQQEIKSLEIEAKASHEQQMASFNELETNIILHNKKIQQIDEDLNQLANDLPNWKDHQAQITQKHPDTTAPSLDLKGELERWKVCLLSIEETLLHCRKKGQDFVSHFSEENVFKFPSSTQREDLDELKTILSEFDEEEKLELIKQESAQTFSNLISVVADQSKLVQKIKELTRGPLKTFNNILDEMKESLIHLKLSWTESNDPLVSLLYEINELSKAAGAQLGGVSLFNPVPDDNFNQRAIELLQRLGELLEEYPDRYLDSHLLFEIDVYYFPDKGETAFLWDSFYRSSWDEQWMSQLIHLAALQFLSKKNKGIEFLILLTQLDVWPVELRNSLIDWIAKQGWQLIASSYSGVGSAQFDRILLLQEDEWKQVYLR
ncbi:MAG: ATP-binding protein [Bacteroidota bacterium]